MSSTEMIIVVFTDLVGSTELCSPPGPDDTEGLRQTHFQLLRQAIAGNDGAEVKNLGDGPAAGRCGLGGAVSGSLGRLGLPVIPPSLRG
jgi:class 3 adenylate cyclase